MPGKNGRSAEIIAWVTAHPGSTGREIGAGVGFNHTGGLLEYMRRTGKIHGSGPRHWTRYYMTAAEAEANHDRIARDAVETRLANERQAHRDGEEKRKKRREAAAVIRRRNAARRAARRAAKMAESAAIKAAERAALAADRKAQREAEAAAAKQVKDEQRARVALAKAMLAGSKVIIPPTVKVTIAPTPPPRFAPAPGFVGAISSDYVARRQGVAL